MNGSEQGNPFSSTQKGSPGPSPHMSRGVSVFQDPDASSALPRDVELSLSLYDTETADRTSMYSMNSIMTTSKMITPMSTKDIDIGEDANKSATVNGVHQNGSSDSGDVKSGSSGNIDNTKPKDTESSNMKVSVTTTSSVKDTDSDKSTSGAPMASGNKVAVNKAGSFQFKSSSGVYRTESSSSKTGVSRSVSRTSSKNENTTPGESYSRIYKAKTTVVTKTGSGSGSGSTVTKSMTVSKDSSDESPPKDMTMPLKIATSGQRVVPKPTTIEQEQQEKEGQQEAQMGQEQVKVSEESTSSKTSLSSAVSDPLSSPSPDISPSGSPFKLQEVAPLNVRPKAPGPINPLEDSQIMKMEDKESVVSSMSSKSNKRSGSSLLSNSSEQSSVPTVTEMDINPPLEPTTSETTVVSSTMKSTTKTLSTTQENKASSTAMVEKMQTSVNPTYEPQDSLTSSLTNVSQVSDTSSIVKNKDFKAKMNMMMANQTPTPYSKPKTKFKTVSPQLSNSDEPRPISPTSPSVPPDDGIQVYKSLPTSPINELKETIVPGKVGNLAKSGMFKHLTGRSMDMSSLERKRGKSSTDPTSPTSPTSPGEKKYKFVVEGIDVPAPETDKTEEKPPPEIPASPPPVMGPDGIPLPPPPPPPQQALNLNRIPRPLSERKVLVMSLMRN